MGDVNYSGRVRFCCNRCVVHDTQVTVVFFLTSPASILCITINVVPKQLINKLIGLPTSRVVCTRVVHTTEVQSPLTKDFIRLHTKDTHNYNYDIFVATKHHPFITPCSIAYFCPNSNYNNIFPQSHKVYTTIPNKYSCKYLPHNIVQMP